MISSVCPITLINKKLFLTIWSKQIKELERKVEYNLEELANYKSEKQNEAIAFHVEFVCKKIMEEPKWQACVRMLLEESTFSKFSGVYNMGNHLDFLSGQFKVPISGIYTVNFE